MGGLIESAIQSAATALVHQDVEAALQAVAADRDVDQKERDIEALCLKLLLQQQPVARDLRFISAALKMITDMERIGDQAADIAELVIYLSREPYIREREHLPQMDDAIDELIATIRQDASAGSQAVDLLMIAKYYERIGDHAQNIAEWVEYALTGQHKGVFLT